MAFNFWITGLSNFDLMLIIIRVYCKFCLNIYLHVLCRKFNRTALCVNCRVYDTRTSTSTSMLKDPCQQIVSCVYGLQDMVIIAIHDTNLHILLFYI